MTTKRNNTGYKVLYRKKGHDRDEIMDYIGFSNTPKLMHYLDKKETLNTETCTCLIVHEHRDDGTIVETYTYDPNGVAGKVQTKPKVKLPPASMVDNKPATTASTPSSYGVAWGRYRVQGAL